MIKSHNKQKQNYYYDDDARNCYFKADNEYSVIQSYNKLDFSLGAVSSSKGLPSITSDTESSKKSDGLPPWLIPFTTAALGGLLFGSDIGCSSSVVRILGGESSEFGALSALQLGQIASSSLFGAMIASAILIFVGDKNIGRKLELQIASVLFLIGTAVQSLSPTLPLIYLGRIIYGLGIGTAMHVAPLYIAETSPNKLRGTLVSLKEAAIVGKIMI